MPQATSVRFSGNVRYTDQDDVQGWPTSIAYLDSDVTSQSPICFPSAQSGGLPCALNVGMETWTISNIAPEFGGMNPYFIGGSSFGAQPTSPSSFSPVSIANFTGQPLEIGESGITFGKVPVLNLSTKATSVFSQAMGLSYAFDSSRVPCNAPVYVSMYVKPLVRNTFVQLAMLHPDGSWTAGQEAFTSEISATAPGGFVRLSLASSIRCTASTNSDINTASMTFAVAIRQDTGALRTPQLLLRSDVTVALVGAPVLN